MNRISISVLRMRAALRDFLQRSDGSLSVETAIILPAICWIYLGSFVWFDVFRMQNVNLRATYTISDLISREPEKVTPGDFSGLASVYDFLNYGSHPTELRLTVIECTANCDTDTSRQLEVCWSRGTLGKLPLTNADMPKFNDEIPLFPVGDELIMTETFMEYTPAYRVGLGSQSFTSVVFTRPRLAPQLKYGEEDAEPDQDKSCANN